MRFITTLTLISKIFYQMRFLVFGEVVLSHEALLAVFAHVRSLTGLKEMFC